MFRERSGFNRDEVSFDSEEVMPELPEVETVVRDLRPRTVGRCIRKVRHASPLMAESRIGPFDKALRGRTVSAIDRRGKWMFFRLSDGNTLVIHLGMTGRLEVVEAKRELLRHTHLRLNLDDGSEELRFVDPRRFGELLLCAPEHLDERFGPKHLGSDALKICLGELADALGKSRRNLKSILLDQRVVAGIGNIYADEILFESRLAPDRLGTKLKAGEIKRLHRSIGVVLRRAIRHNGTSIRDYVTGNGVPGEFQNRLRVYGRSNLPCKICGTPIEWSREVVNGRTTHWCPSCQSDK
ncbi:MAG: DNA-formamidopyrimidine glycosylase [Planctomycetota bacterium]